MKFFQWPTNFENHLPFRFSVKICQACGECKPSPFANSLQRIGKHTAFAFGECKVNVYNFAPKLHKKACRLLNYEIWEPFKKFLHGKVFGECIGRPMARPMQNNPLPFSAYMRHRQGKPRKAPGGLLSSGPRSRGCTGSSAHLDRRWSGRVGRHQPIDRQQQVSMF
jgi:hypothetical protein